MGTYGQPHGQTEVAQDHVFFKIGGPKTHTRTLCQSCVLASAWHQPSRNCRRNLRLQGSRNRSRSGAARRRSGAARSRSTAAHWGRWESCRECWIESQNAWTASSVATTDSIRQCLKDCGHWWAPSGRAATISPSGSATAAPRASCGSALWWALPRHQQRCARHRQSQKNPECRGTGCQSQKTPEYSPVGAGRRGTGCRGRRVSRHRAPAFEQCQRG